MFRKPKDDASAGALTTGLPDERKALAERYTIDAKEAESRADRAEEERRREAEFEARRAAALQARREIAQRPQTVVAEPVRQGADEITILRDPVPERPPAERTAIERSVVEQPVVEQPVVERPVREQPVVATPAAAGAFPIYGWMQQSTAPPDTKADWTRTLLRAAVEEQREKASRALSGP